jgi:glycosyltransferase involved in cell wall biosynthesis
MTSIVLTIHNQEEIIDRVLKGIYDNSVITTHLIIIFDGCTDKSEDITREFIKAQPEKFLVIYLNTPNVFETKANNLGLRWVNCKYGIIVQDDCVINDLGWDKRLITPMEQFINLFAVTGRTAHNIILLDNGLVDYTDEADRRHGMKRDTLYIRQVVNRGPLALKMDVVKYLNYFDTLYCPQNGDDHDLCLRASKINKFCGSYWINTISEPHWGGTRKGDGNWIRTAIEKNMRILRERHYDIISKPFENKEIVFNES